MYDRFDLKYLDVNRNNLRGLTKPIHSLRQIYNKVQSHFKFVWPLRFVTVILESTVNVGSILEFTRSEAYLSTLRSRTKMGNFRFV